MNVRRGIDMMDVIRIAETAHSMEKAVSTKAPPANRKPGEDIAA